MSTNKKRQKLTICLLSKAKDWAGVWEVRIMINDKPYIYFINSEYALEKFEKLLRQKKPGKALHLLSLFKVQELVDLWKEGNNGVQSSRISINEDLRNTSP